MSCLEDSRAESGQGLTACQTEFDLAVVVCAWCKPGSRGPGLTALSHGICPRHLKKMISKMDHQPRKRRKRLSSPENISCLPFEFAPSPVAAGWRLVDC
jgi:hypothetical protein